MLGLLLIGLISLLALWFWNDHRKHSKGPPGPLRLPIFGNIPQLARLSPYPGIAFNELSKKYGELVYIRMGFANVVICNSAESIQQIRSHELCQIRGIQMIPAVVNRNSGKNLGLIVSSGDVHDVLRSFTIRKLREFGLGKSAPMDQLVNDEVEILIEMLKSQFEGKDGGVIDNVGDLLFISISRVMNRYTTGTSYEYDDPKIKRLLQLSHDVFQSFNIGMSVSIAYPFLFDWFPNLCGKNMQTEAFRKLKAFFQEAIDERRAEGSYKSCTNTFMDEFLLKIDKDKGQKDTLFTDEQLVMCLLDLFQAASDGSSNAIAISLLYMILHQNVQEKVQKELDANLGDGETIGYETREKIPYTHATLLESLRYFTNVPTNAPHLVSGDFYYKGFLIKKGTFCIGNHYAVHYNEKIWGDPHTFRPERFLKADGTLDTKIANQMILFGSGPRACLGMSLGQTSNFIYFATLLRKFTFKKVQESDILSTEPTLGVNQAARPYRVKVTSRS